MPEDKPSREDLIAKVAAKRKREELIKRVQEKRAAEAEPTGGEQAEAALSGFGESATFGYLPEIQAATYPLVEKAGELITGQDIPDEPYEQRLEAARRQTAQTQEKAPGYALAGQLGGFLVPGAGTAKGAKALAQAGKGGRLAKLAAGAAGQGGLAQRAKGLATLGAAEGLAYNPLRYDTQSERTVGKQSDRLQAALTGAAFGAVLPGAEKAVSAATKGLYHGAGKLGRKVLATMGVEERTIKEYLENPELITKATDYESVKHKIDDVIRPIRQELNDAEIDYAKAMDRFDNAKVQISSHFKEKGKEISQAFQEAKKKLDFEYKNSYDQLNKVEAPLYLQESVETGLERLKTQVVKGSGEALNILQKEVRDDVDITGAAALLDDAMESIMIKGEIPKAGPGKEIALQIKALQDDLARFEGRLTPYDAKRYIKNLDQYIDWGEREFGQFSRADVYAAKDVRAYLDKTLKDASPGYAEMMEAVADDARTLSMARQHFGNSRKISQSLNNIDKPINNEKRAALEALGSRIGIDYAEDVAHYIGVKNELKNLRSAEGKQEFIRNLDGWDDFEKASQKLEKWKKRTDLENRVLKQRALRMTEEAAEAELAKERMINAKKAVEQIKIFKEETSESKLNRMITLFNSGKRGQGMTLRQEFEKLTQMGDEDFLKLVRSLSMQERFDRAFIRGSRNVNLFTMLGIAGESLFSARSGMGGAVGGVLGGPMGVIIGSTFGAMVDHYGPAMTKKILDGVLYIKGIPTSEKIQALNLPQGIKNDLINQFEHYAMAVYSGQPVEVAPEDIPAIREDIARNHDHLHPVDRAKMISHLNKTGEIKNPELILGQPQTIEDISKKKANFKLPSKWGDTGREVEFGSGPMEVMESAIGAPFRSFLSKTLEGKPLEGISAAKGRFLKDPSLSPTYSEILARQGMKEGTKKTSLEMALNLLEPGVPGMGLAKTGKFMPMMGTVKKVGKKEAKDLIKKLEAGEFPEIGEGVANKVYDAGEVVIKKAKRNEKDAMTQAITASIFPEYAAGTKVIRTKKGDYLIQDKLDMDADTSDKIMDAFDEAEFARGMRINDQGWAEGKLFDMDASHFGPARQGGRQYLFDEELGRRKFKDVKPTHPLMMSLEERKRLRENIIDLRKRRKKGK